MAGGEILNKLFGAWGSYLTFVNKEPTRLKELWEVANNEAMGAILYFKYETPVSEKMQGILKTNKVLRTQIFGE
jgi:hypothetical protein